MESKPRVTLSRAALATKTHVMGIVNATPDSFSDGGEYNTIEKATAHGIKLVEEGADVLDVGGESTRPGAAIVDAEEEIRRVIPIIQSLAAKTNVPISIDTYKARVAEAAVKAGATVINDVWGGIEDPDILTVAANADAHYVLTHNRTTTNYADFTTDVLADLERQIEAALKAGVKDGHLILDPGIGFAKSPQQNMDMLRQLHTLCSWPYPVLLGTSRKSFIGQVLDLPVDQRLEGTGATVCYGVMQGVTMVRVHDVQAMSRMTKMMDALLGKGEQRG